MTSSVSSLRWGGGLRGKHPISYSPQVSWPLEEPIQSKCESFSPLLLGNLEFLKRLPSYIYLHDVFKTYRKHQGSKRHTATNPTQNSPSHSRMVAHSGG